MRFSDLPRVAQIMIAGACAAGIAALSWGFGAPVMRHPGAAAVYLALAFIVASKRITLHANVATLSLGFIVVLAALFTCGPTVGMAAAALNVVGCFVLVDAQQRQPLFAMGYNASTLVVAALAAGAAFEPMVGPAPVHRLTVESATAVVVAVAIYWGVSVVSLGVASTLGRGQLKLPTREWWLEIINTAPAYLAGGASAFVLDALFAEVGYWVFALGVPFAWVVHWAMTSQSRRIAGKLARTEELNRAYFATVRALSTAIDVKDHGTHEHVQRVHHLATGVAERLGLEGDECDAVGFGAVLHDIGKIAIPDRVLLKPGKLTDEEFKLVQAHPAAGEAILRPINFGPDVSTDVSSIVRHHHEKLDGTGYPDGLTGDEICMGARILAAIDVYDALISDRSYRKAWTPQRALELLRSEAGTSWDTDVVEALAEVLESEESTAPETDATDQVLVQLSGRAQAFAADTGDDVSVQDEELHLDHARRQALAAATDLVATQEPLLACVAYEVDARHCELEAVAASGPLSSAFRLARLPADSEGSSRALSSGQIVRSASAVAEQACFLEAVSERLATATVTALPIASRAGEVVAVLSLYASPGDEPTDESLAALAPATNMLGRQLDLLGANGVTPAPARAYDTASG